MCFLWLETLYAVKNPLWRFPNCTNGNTWAPIWVMMWRFKFNRSLSKPMMTPFTGLYSSLGRNELTCFLEPFNHFRHWHFRRWNGRGVKRTRALGLNETPLGVRWHGAILPRSILPHSAILPQHTMFHFAPEFTFREKPLYELRYHPLLNQMM